MCVVVIGWRASADYPLVIVGNRDELHARPAASLARWDDRSGLIGGRDLISGGTWLGLSAEGAFGVVTNRRSDHPMDPQARSRGLLLADWLSEPGAGRMDAVGEYNPVNLALVTPAGAEIVSNWPQVRRRTVEAGVFGLSNGDIDDRSSRVEALKPALKGWLARPGEVEPLLEALRDEAPTQAPGVDPLFGLAPVFMHHPIYGTRCSTVITVDRTGAGVARERSYDETGRAIGDAVVEFSWAGSPTD